MSGNESIAEVIGQTLAAASAEHETVDSQAELPLLAVAVSIVVVRFNLFALR